MTCSIGRGLEVSPASFVLICARGVYIVDFLAIEVMKESVSCVFSIRQDVRPPLAAAKQRHRISKLSSILFLAAAVASI